MIDTTNPNQGFVYKKTESPHVLRTEDLVFSMAIGFYNQLAFNGDSWMLTGGVYQPSDLSSLDDRLKHIKNVNGDIPEMKVFATGNSIYPSQDAGIDQNVRVKQMEYRQQVENLLYRNFSTNNMRVKWLDDSSDGELTLDASTGRFEMRVVSLAPGYEGMPIEYDSF